MKQIVTVCCAVGDKVIRQEENKVKQIMTVCPALCLAGQPVGDDKVIKQEDRVKQIVTCAVCVSGKPVGDDKAIKQEEDKVKQIVKKVRLWK